jgi:hypothetical protein
VPSHLHEALVELFRQHPVLAAELLRGQLGVPVPMYAKRLPEAARANLEEPMATGTYEYQSDFARRYYGQGRVEGEATALLGFLEARGIAVPDDAHKRITQCTDLEQFATWIRRAATISTIDELFD